MANPSDNSINPRRSSFNYIRQDPARTKIRKMLLVITTLIAAVTFQAGVNPPGWVWQDNQGHDAGHRIYSTHSAPFHVFLVFNTNALATSILLIILFTYQYPFRLLIVAATAPMMVTYGSPLFAVVPGKKVKFRYITLTAFAPVIVRAFRECYGLSIVNKELLVN